ncbi:MAG: hypothetical protein WC980_09745 [Candidatus Brocadiia bacterium]
MRFIIYTALILIIIALFTFSFLTPWAKGKAIIIGQTVYASQEKVLLGAYVASALLVFITLILLSRKKFIFGVLCLMVGSWTILAGIYLWQKIQAKSISFVFNFVDVRPDIGLMFFIGAGGVVVILALVYMVDSAISGVFK